MAARLPSGHLMADRPAKRFTLGASLGTRDDPAVHGTSRQRTNERKGGKPNSDQGRKRHGSSFFVTSGTAVHQYTVEEDKAVR